MTGYFRVVEAARVVGVSVKTIRRALRDPEHPLPAYRVGRKLLVISEIDLNRWLEGRRVVGLLSQSDPEISAFLGDLLQPNCNRSQSRMKKCNAGKANPATDPLICSQQPTEKGASDA